MFKTAVTTGSCFINHEKGLKLLVGKLKEIHDLCRDVQPSTLSIISIDFTVGKSNETSFLISETVLGTFKKYLKMYS